MPTLFGPFFAAFPDLFLRIAFTHDGVLFAVHACPSIRPCRPKTTAAHLHRGLASSHFFFRFLHVKQPVLVRPLVTLLAVRLGVRGCFRGRPLGRFGFGWSSPSAWATPPMGVAGASPKSSIQNPSSSKGSSFGAINSSSGSSCSQGMCSWCMSWWWLMAPRGSCSCSWPSSEPE